jgi:hypothetical protein
MTALSASKAAAALVASGLADDLDDAYAQLEDLGEIEVVTTARIEA